MRAKNNLYRGLFILWLLPFLACGPGTNNNGEGTKDGGSNTQKETLTPDATSSEKISTNENNCTNRCSEGTKQCAKDGPQTCEIQANGCTDWSAATPCSTGQICDAGSCVSNCTNRCSEGTKQCAKDGPQTCEIQTNGCTDWSTPTPCPTGQVCSGGLCASNCTNQCSEGTKRCNSRDVQHCEKTTAGCTDWVTKTTCTTTQTCDDKSYTCVQSCTDSCAVDATKCGANNGVILCKLQANGCRDWEAEQACPANQACKNGKCEKTCTDMCTQNSTQCANHQVQTCTTQSNGCFDWEAPKDCPAGETCQGTQCKPGCINLCIPQQTTCQNGQQLECVQVGKCWNWGNAKPCPSGTTCHLGTCAKGDETLSQSKEMCGEHVYTGILTIQGGTKITCKTGDLTIRAKRIFLDPASSIDLSGVSTSASGAKFNTCSPQSCYSDRGRTGAGGGGNGTVGTKSTGTEYKYRVGQYGSCSCSTCSGASGGGLRDTNYDQRVSEGGKGGDGCKYVNTYGSTICSATDELKGGEGGGKIRLFADEKVTILGKVLADGSSGAAGAAGAGGGAGGGILLAAPDIEITGTVSAAGGAGGTGTGFSASCYTSNKNTDGGAGGKGRIKILYGSNYKNTGTLNGGAESLSWLPPQSLSSSTHPEQSVHYNDDFTKFDITWASPYTGAQGYWYAFDKKSDLQLTPTNGTYTTKTNLSFPTSTFTSSGIWYFYILTVHSNAQASTVANRWAFQLNSKAHTLASTSHTDTNAWYSDPNKKALAIAWTPPSGTEARSFRGFWYKVDRTSDTAPGRAAAGWTYTTNTQALITQDASGQMLDSWVYYFHLVAEDTAGNLTKVAAHYRIQLGTEPAKMNFFGYVKDANGGAIDGVEVKLQPYGLKATTDNNGYFIFNNLYVGTYQLSAAKAGLKDVGAQVDVKATTVPYNFTMTP